MHKEWLGGFLTFANDEDAWEAVKTKDTVAIASRVVPGTNVKAFRGRGVVNASAQAVFDYIMDLSNVPSHDPSCISVYEIERLSPTLHWQYSAFASPAFGVSGRDFLMAVLAGAQSDGSFLIVHNSIAHAELVPKQPSASLVRGAFRGGFHVVPIDGASCTLTFVLCTDPKGSVPTWLVNSTGASQALDVAAIRNDIHARVAAGEFDPSPALRPLAPSVLLDEPPASTPSTAATAEATLPAGATRVPDAAAGVGALASLARANVSDDNENLSYSYYCYTDSDNGDAAGAAAASPPAPPRASELRQRAAELEAQVALAKGRVTDAEARLATMERQLAQLTADSRAAKSKGGCCTVS